MTGTRDDSANPSRRAVLGAGSALLGANLVSAAAASPPAAQLAQLSLPAKAPETPPPGYNILFIFVDQEHFFDKWAFPVPGREYLKKNGTTFANHQSASQVCSSARSTVYTGWTLQPDWRNRGAIRSIFDGRYRFSRYFSPIEFNRPTTYEDLVTKNDLEVYDHQEDPDETRNLAQDGKAKAELTMALNATLNARIDEEIGDDDGRFLPIRNGAWYPTQT